MGAAPPEHPPLSNVDFTNYLNPPDARFVDKKPAHGGTSSHKVEVETASRLSESSSSSSRSNWKVTAAKVVGCIIVAALVGAGIAALGGALPGTEGISIYNTAPTPLEATGTALIGVGVAIPIGIGIGKGGEALGMSMVNFYRSFRAKAKEDAENKEIRAYVDAEATRIMEARNKAAKAYADAKAAVLKSDPGDQSRNPFEVFEQRNGSNVFWCYVDMDAKRQAFDSKDKANKTAADQANDALIQAQHTPYKLDFAPPKDENGVRIPRLYYFMDNAGKHHPFETRQEAEAALKKMKPAQGS